MAALQNPIAPTRKSGRRAPRQGALTIALACLFVLSTASAFAASAGEYQVKAAFLYNFARFVDWPNRSGATASVTICILGDDPFGGDINVIVGKPVGDRKLQVRRLASASGAADCQILFVSGSESPDLGRALGAIKGRPVLTVADTPGFAERGVVINLYVDQGKVRFEINVDAAKRAQLDISSQLLKLARITKDKGGANG